MPQILNRWVPVTFDAMWRAAVGADPAAPFLRFEDRRGDVTEWTYGEFDRAVEGATNRLSDAGVSAGSAVHLALTNSPTFVAVWLAAVRLGAWIVPSDPMATTPELGEHLLRTSPVVGFCAVERVETYRNATGLPPTVIEVDESDAVLDWLTHPLGTAQTRADARTARPPGSWRSGRRDVHERYDRATQGRRDHPGQLRLRRSDDGGGVRPHGRRSPTRRAPVVPRQRPVLLVRRGDRRRRQCGPDADVLGERVRRAGCPARRDVRQLVRRPDPHDSRSRRSAPPEGPALQLRHCWYAQNLTAAQYETIGGWLGCRPRQLYGMTETIPAVLTDRRDDPRCDTMGDVTPGCDVELADGEIVVGGEPGITLFAGYLDDPATTAASFRNGWFLTGDRAHRDEDGRFVFDGRHSDVLKVAGENVSVVEVEHVFAMHPEVADVAVVGAPDPIRDEVPVAVVVPVADAGPLDALRQELEQWCAERLGKAKRPQRVSVRRRAAAYERGQDQEVSTPMRVEP